MNRKDFENLGYAAENDFHAGESFAKYHGSKAIVVTGLSEHGTTQKLPEVDGPFCVNFYDESDYVGSMTIESGGMAHNQFCNDLMSKMLKLIEENFFLS